MIQPHGSHSRNPRWELVAPEMDNITCESHQGQEQGVWSGGMFVIITGWWFFATPLKNMSSSVGIIIPN